MATNSVEVDIGANQFVLALSTFNHVEVPTGGSFPKGSIYGGASLIAPNLALTAAHCVSDRTFPFRYGGKQYTVAEMGIGVTHSVTEFQNRRSLNPIEVKKIHIHPKWQLSHHLDYDVAILELAESITTVKPIKIADKHLLYELQAYGGKAHMAGWGSIQPYEAGYETWEYPAHLRKVELNVLDRYRTVRALMGIATITPRMLSAVSSDGQDACAGDSGSPIFVIDSEPFQIGIVSWGVGCGQRNRPALFTDLSHDEISQWLAEKISELTDI